MKIPDLAKQTQRCELLVSVRSFAEAEIAAAESIDILDFKEPTHGPLAPVESYVWRQAAAHFKGHEVTDIQLSAALGESNTAILVAGEVPESFAFAKAGPHRCGCAKELTNLWAKVRGVLAPSVELVAVAYADAKAAETLEPEEIVRLASERGFRRILIDTYLKDGKSSVEHLNRDRLRELRSATKAFGMRLMLAGAIRLEHFDRWLEPDTQPDGFGVRGDICESGRESKLAPERIRLWRERLSALRKN